jgi:hypothetical protein
VPPDDFFDDDWEEPSKTQDTAITRPGSEPPARARGRDPEPAAEQPTRAPRPPRQPRPQRRGPQVPKMPKMPKMPRVSAGGAAASLPPLEYRRLAGLGVGILVVILVLVLLARGCSGSSTKGANESYVTSLTTQVLKPSDAVATSFSKMLQLPRATYSTIQKQLNQQLSAMRKVKESAAALKPTKQLAPYQPALLDALQFRVTGLQCMSERLKAAWAVKRPLAAGQQLSTCTGRLLTSDYVYSDLFANSANATLKQVGATGVPTSQFLAANEVNLVTPIGIGQALQRLHPGAVHGIHGTELGTVVASAPPTVLTLQPGTTNQVLGKSNLEFVISVKNSGKFTEVGVNVQFKLKRVGSTQKPLVKTAKIASIAPGQTQQVSIKGLFASSQTQPNFSVQYKLTVTSEKVPGEHVLSNNSASYIVEFKIAA